MLEVFDNPVLLDQPDELTETYPEVFPACAVTRAQARKRDDFELSSSLLHLFLLTMFYHKLKVRRLKSLLLLV